MPSPMTPFAGNNIFLSGGQPVMPANAIAEKLRAGNFGPFPNQSAPPGYVLPPAMDPGKIASALRSNILPNIAGGAPPAATPPPPGMGAFSSPVDEINQLSQLVIQSPENSSKYGARLHQLMLQNPNFRNMAPGEGFGPGANGIGGGYGPGPGSSGADLGAAGMLGW